jgi:putative nucleotidyltransferase with HDIG domain
MTEGGERWRARPVATLAVKAVILLVPIAAGSLAGLALAQAVAPPSGTLARVAWSIMVLAASTLVLMGMERLVRRLAPLALLLRLSLVFPDQAPKRFGIALRAVRPGRQPTDADHQDEAAASLALLASLLSHDRRTRGHSERVAAYASMVADELGLDEAEKARVTWGALLHDVGKLQVPTAILNKPAALDDAEWKVMSGHPAAGRELVAPLRPWLGDALTAVDGHHERFDGTGYPDHRLAGELPMAARVTAVADAFETMTAARSYKEPMPIGEARAEVARCAGGQFDPVVCRAFLALSVPKLWRVAGPMAWLAQVPLVGLLVRGELVPVALGSATQGAVAATGQALTAAAVVGGALAAGGVTAPVDPARAEPAAVVVEEDVDVPAVDAPTSSPSVPDLPDGQDDGDRHPDRPDRTVAEPVSGTTPSTPTTTTTTTTTTVPVVTVPPTTTTTTIPVPTGNSGQGNGNGNSGNGNNGNGNGNSGHGDNGNHNGSDNGNSGNGNGNGNGHG